MDISQATLPTQNVEKKADAHTIPPSGIVRRHKRHEGVIAVPTASGAVRMIRLHDAYETETIDVVASKDGQPPFVPSFEDVDDNRTFLGGERVVSNPVLAGGMDRHAWHVTAHYEYVLEEATGLDSELLGGRLAGDTTLVVTHNSGNQNLPKVNLPAEIFVTGLLGRPFPQ